MPKCIFVLINKSYKLLFMSFILLLITGCGDHSSDENGSDMHPGISAAHVTQVQVRLMSASHTQQASSWVDNLAFQLQTSTISLLIEAPDFETRVEDLSALIQRGAATVYVPTGPDRTFKLEALNNRGVTIYDSHPQTVDLIEGEAVSLEFVLLPIAVVESAALAMYDHPEQELTVVVDDAQSPLAGLSLTIPANTISKPTDIRIDEMYNPNDVPYPEMLASLMVNIAPEDLYLTTPSTMKIPYNQQMLDSFSLSKTDIQVNRFEPDSRTWVPIDTASHDTAGNVLTVNLNQFGLYAITSMHHEPTPPAEPEPKPVMPAEPTPVTTLPAEPEPEPIQPAKPTSVTAPPTEPEPEPAPPDESTPVTAPPTPESLTVTIVFTWMAPKTNTDESPLTNLAGYELWLGRKERNASVSHANHKNLPDSYRPLIEIDNKDNAEEPLLNVDITINSDEKSPYCFSVIAYSVITYFDERSRNRSYFSNEVCVSVSDLLGT